MKLSPGILMRALQALQLRRRSATDRLRDPAPAWFISLDGNLVANSQSYPSKSNGIINFIEVEGDEVIYGREAVEDGKRVFISREEVERGEFERELDERVDPALARAYRQAMGMMAQNLEIKGLSPTRDRIHEAEQRMKRELQKKQSQRGPQEGSRPLQKEEAPQLQAPSQAPSMDL